MPKKKLAIVTFNFPPDFGAAAFRVQSLVEAIKNRYQLHNLDLKITVICAKPFRYRYRNKADSPHSSNHIPKDIPSSLNNIEIVRLGVPLFGCGFVLESLSYLFFLVQGLAVLVWSRPNLIFATSAKLLTSYLAALGSVITGATLCVDIRDTFSDNFLSFFRRQRKIVAYLLILYLENFVVRQSKSINLISPGFSQIYDELLESNKLTYFTNGVDEHFVKFYYSLKDKQVSQDPPFIIKNRTILYAGNLGLGQDIIELFKPLVYQDIAQQLTDLGWSIRIIGDGVQAPDLKQLASQPHLRKLITVLNPIPRYELIEEYQKADALFLQVGNYRSLDMVIPSKIFEYAATRLPILAGVRGYTRDFIDQIPGVQFFTQKNITSFLGQIKEIKTFSHNRDQFIEQYDRTKIMVKYADHLLDQLQTKDVSLSFPIAEKSRGKITASNL